MYNGFAIILAWPNTFCKQASSWYDIPLGFLGINEKGYYKVGHAAIILIQDECDQCKYFDFGRYHAPIGSGRVRSVESDFDLGINTSVVFSNNGNNILNIDAILDEVNNNNSCHGDGQLFASVVRVNYNLCIDKARAMQAFDFIKYGPFLSKGTNCSRFVNSILSVGLDFGLRLCRYRFPISISPTPMGNVKASRNFIHKRNKLLKLNIS